MKSFLLVLISAILVFSHNYTNALHLTTYFYGSQRCGVGNSWLHENCHLRDGELVGVDLTGGWHDCGDHIKFSHTTAFTATALLLGYQNFKESYKDNYSFDNSSSPGNGIPDILDEVKWQTDLFIKSIMNNHFYYQVGDSTDHSSMSVPEYQSENLSQQYGGNPRYVYSISEGGSNICGETAAALALMYSAYKTIDISYANTCLQKAKEVFAIGDSKHEAIQSASKPDDPHYVAGNWADDMALGAIELFKATNDSTYLTKAIEFYQEPDFRKYPDWNVLFEGDVSAFAEFELFKVTGDSIYLNSLKKYEIDSQMWNQTECGYMFFASWGSLNFALNGAFIVALYNTIVDQDEYHDFVVSNVNFALGTHDSISPDAPSGFSFVAGYNYLNKGFTKYFHHAGAFGYGEDAWDNYFEEIGNPGLHYVNELTGALTGGPTGKCNEDNYNYEDNIDNVEANEPGIYYNAGIVGALAYLVSLDTSSSNLVSSKSITFQEENLSINETTITFNVKQPQSGLRIFNTRGRVVKNYNNLHMGLNRINISNLAISSGIYYVVGYFENKQIVQKMVLNH